MFHDTRECREYFKKSVYDVDLYQRVSASFVLYLEKRKLEKYITEMNIEGNKIMVLRPEAELVAIIIHSIIPEMLCTLLVFYATVHYLIKMSPEEINRFVEIARENNVTFSIKTHFSLVAELHKTAYGFVPKEIEKVLTELGCKTNEINYLVKNNYKMPHRYSWSVIIRTLLEKMNEKEFRMSVLKQMVNMLNPKLVRWVISEIIRSRKRETY